MQISRSDMERILDEYEAFSPLTLIFKTFGVQTREYIDPEGFFISRMSKRGLQGSPVYEMCYKFFYVAENGRGRGSPWSLRQIGLYQQVCSQTGSCHFLLLQPAQKVLDLIEIYLSEFATRRASPLRLHCMIARCMIANWAEYLQHIYKSISDLDERACFSQVDPRPKRGFEVSFSDCQTLQIHRQKLLHASIILDRYINLFQRFADDAASLKLTFPDEDWNAIPKQLAAHESQIRTLQKFTEMILRQSEGTSTLLSKIIDSRNSNLLHAATLTMQNHLALINKTSNKSQNDLMAMVSLTKQNAQASKTVKFLTLTATTYLPPTLMATIFSSNLIQLSGQVVPGQSDAQRHYVLHSQFYLYVLGTLGLTTLTLGAIWLHGRGIKLLRHLLGLNSVLRNTAGPSKV
ncbi:hypothetical protein ASPCAL11634 [Aspergillus calidoustus]|nr:hypothetical protein ASPCAL11634 [Aspergillus calidoustus]